MFSPRRRVFFVWPTPSLDWLEGTIGEIDETTIGPRLGPGPGDAKEARALNRIVRWCDDRVEYEADPGQVGRLVVECGLAGANEMATPVSRPDSLNLKVMSHWRSTFTQLSEGSQLERTI